MSADVAGWQTEQELEDRRRLRTAIGVSVAIHALMLAAFVVSPPVPLAEAPEYISVDLIAPAIARPAGRPAAATQPTPAPAEPAPAPEPAAATPAPIAEAPTEVLPEESPATIREAMPPPKPAPKEVAKVATPKPKPAPRRRRGEREREVSLEEAMAALNDELGADEPSDLVTERATQTEKPTDATSSGKPGGESKISPEQAAWQSGVRRLISKRFVNLARYRGQGLVVQVEINVGPTGAVSGEPRLIRTSGDIDFDRRAISAVQLAAPLPPPVKPGPVRLNLTSEER